jgi:hypothetical protein
MTAMAVNKKLGHFYTAKTNGLGKWHVGEMRCTQCFGVST